MNSMMIFCGPDSEQSGVSFDFTSNFATTVKIGRSTAHWPLRTFSGKCQTNVANICNLNNRFLSHNLHEPYTLVGKCPNETQC